MPETAAYSGFGTLTGIWQEIVLFILALGVVFPKWYEFDKWKIILGSNYEIIANALNNQYIKIIIACLFVTFFFVKRIGIRDEKIKSLEDKIRELENSLSAKEEKGGVHMHGNIYHYYYSTPEGVKTGAGDAEFNLSKLNNLS